MDVSEVDRDCAIGETSPFPLRLVLKGDPLEPHSRRLTFADITISLPCHRSSFPSCGRQVREVTYELAPYAHNLRWQSSALLALQEATGTWRSFLANLEQIELMDAP